MLMKTYDMPIEVEQESEQLKNCRALLNYIDTGFQERIKQGDVSYFEFCGIKQCLLGWYCADVLRTDYYKWSKSGHMEAKERHFGENLSIFGVVLTLHQRRTALVAHIESMEAAQ